VVECTRIYFLNMNFHELSTNYFFLGQELEKVGIVVELVRMDRMS